MSEHKYTVSEIDALRSAVTMRVNFGTTRLNPGATIGRVWSSGEMQKAVEEQVRTYMLAGISARDLYDADAPKEAK